MHSLTSDQIAAARKRRRLSCEPGPDNMNGYVGDDLGLGIATHSATTAHQNSNSYSTFTRGGSGYNPSSSTTGSFSTMAMDQYSYPILELTSSTLTSNAAVALGQLQDANSQHQQQQHNPSFASATTSPAHTSSSASSSGTNSPVSSVSSSNTSSNLLSLPTFESSTSPFFSTSTDNYFGQSPRGTRTTGILNNLSPPKLKGFQPGEVLAIGQQQQQQQQAAQQVQFGRRRSLGASSRSFTAQMLDDNPNESMFPFPFLEDDDADYSDSSSLLASQMGTWMSTTPGGPPQYVPIAAAPAPQPQQQQQQSQQQQQTAPQSSGSFSMPSGAVSPASMQMSAPSSPSSMQLGYRNSLPQLAPQQPSLPLSLPVSVNMQSSPPRGAVPLPAGLPYFSTSSATTMTQATAMLGQQRQALRPIAVAPAPALASYPPSQYPMMYPTLHEYQQQELQQQQILHQMQMQHIQQQQQQQAMAMAANASAGTGASATTATTTTKKGSGRRRKEKGETMEDNWKSVIAHTNTNNVQLQRSKWWWYIQSEKLRLNGPAGAGTASTSSAAPVPAAPSVPAPAPAPATATPPCPVMTVPRGSCGEALGLPTSPSAVVNNKPGDTNKTGDASSATGRKKAGGKKGSLSEEDGKNAQQRRKLPARSKLHDLIEWVRNLDPAQAEQQIGPQELI